MDKQRSIEDSLNGLEELAQRIERSQRFGQSPSHGIVRGWATTMDFHLQNLRKELKAKPTKTVGAGSVVDS